MLIQEALLLVTALEWEARAVRGPLEGVRGAGRLRNGRLRAGLWRGIGEGAGVWVLCGGMGRERILGALAWAGPIVRPKIVISTGCAGALDAGVGVGDLVIADEVVGGETGRGPRRSSPSWSERYARAAKMARVPGRIGRLYTSGSLLPNEKAKAAAARETGAVAVDMETAAIAEWASTAGADFAAARVILDSLATPAPAELAASIGPTGRPRPYRVLWTLLRNPRIVSDLASLASAQRRCYGALGAVHKELFKELR